MADQKECPYCKETIKAEADVCRYCGREVKKIFDLQNQLDELNKKLAQVAPAKGIETIAKPNKLIAFINAMPLWLFGLLYLVIAIVLNITMFFAGYDSNVHTQTFSPTYCIIVLSGLIVITTWLGMKYMQNYNIWGLMIYIVIQQFLYVYIVTMPISFFRNKTSGDPLTANSDFHKSILWSLITCCAVLLISTPLIKRYIKKHQATNIYSTKYIWGGGINKIINIIITAGGFIGGLITIWGMYH